MHEAQHQREGEGEDQERAEIDQQTGGGGAVEDSVGESGIDGVERVAQQLLAHAVEAFDDDEAEDDGPRAGGAERRGDEARMGGIGWCHLAMASRAASQAQSRVSMS